MRKYTMGEVMDIVKYIEPDGVVSILQKIKSAAMDASGMDSKYLLDKGIPLDGSPTPGDTLVRGWLAEQEWIAVMGPVCGLTNVRTDISKEILGLSAMRWDVLCDLYLESTTSSPDGSITPKHSWQECVKRLSGFLRGVVRLWHIVRSTPNLAYTKNVIVVGRFNNPSVIISHAAISLQHSLWQCLSELFSNGNKYDYPKPEHIDRGIMDIVNLYLKPLDNPGTNSEHTGEQESFAAWEARSQQRSLKNNKDSWGSI